jgi:hypothetical protein
VFAVPPLRGDEVVRPRLMAELVEAVTRPGVTAAVGMTTGLWGAGGLGKTTFIASLSEIPPLNTEQEMTVLSVGVDDAAAQSVARTRRRTSPVAGPRRLGAATGAG